MQDVKIKYYVSVDILLNSVSFVMFVYLVFITTRFMVNKVI